MNRKERFPLVGEALGNPAFQRGDGFRSRLTAKVGSVVPADAFVAIDYHLDWIHAAVSVGEHRADINRIHSNAKGIATGTQEDVDSIVAFRTKAATHIIMTEAKAETGWATDQAGSKAARLRVIFGEEGNEHAGIKPSYVLMSPRPPKRLATENWPSWMLRTDGEAHWIELTAKLQAVSVSPDALRGPNRPHRTGRYGELGHATKASSGTIARRQPYIYQLGGGHEHSHSDMRGSAVERWAETNQFGIYSSG